MNKGNKPAACQVDPDVSSFLSIRTTSDQPFLAIHPASTTHSQLNDKQLAEANANAEKKAKLVESKDAEIKNAVETAKRKETISELIAPLSKEQKEIMQDLLESVATDKLEGNFNKYLPAVIDGKSVAKKATLTEAKEITGDKEENSSSASNSAKVDNVVDIRRLAGLN